MAPDRAPTVNILDLRLRDGELEAQVDRFEAQDLAPIRINFQAAEASQGYLSIKDGLVLLSERDYLHPESTLEQPTPLGDGAYMHSEWVEPSYPYTAIILLAPPAFTFESTTPAISGAKVHNDRVVIYWVLRGLDSTGKASITWTLKSLENDLGSEVRHLNRDSVRLGRPVAAAWVSGERYDKPDGQRVLLVTATNVETSTVLELAEARIGIKAELRAEGKIAYWHLGELNGHQVLIVQSQRGSGGVGGSAFTVSDAIRSLKPSAVIAVGICFGMPRKTALGDVILAQQLQAYELQRAGVDRTIPRGDKVSSDPGLFARLQARGLDRARIERGLRVKAGLLLSGEKLVDDTSFRDQLEELEPEAVGGEMEGTGVAAAANREKTPWIVVKGVCDFADGKKRVKKKERQARAARNAADLVLEVLATVGLR
jgi:nucleoside phosphorylase